MNVKAYILKRKLHNVPPKVNVALVSSLVLNCVTFPFTVVLNLVVIVAVKTRQRLRTNSNVVIACLETTDLLVGVFVQPFYFPVVMSVISTLEGDLSSTTCLIRLTFSNGRARNVLRGFAISISFDDRRAPLGHFSSI